MRLAGGTRIGIVGTGWLSRHFLMSLDRHRDMSAARVLTRRPVDACGDFPRPDLLTRSVDDLLDRVDVVVECSGDPLHAADVVAAAFAAGLPVVTMDAEFHVTCGSWFVGRGLMTEAAGDQPGSLALLAREVRAMGFEPLVYGNMKGFLNRDPTPDEMAHWAARQGISVPMVTSFTDGTKVQAEQVLVANGLGAAIARPGLAGPAADDLQAGADLLCAEADRLGRPVADYVLARGLPHGVFVAARHDGRHRDALRYLKMGDGPNYVVVRPAVLAYLEIASTIRELLDEGRILLDNGSRPEASVAAVAKRTLEPGELVERGAGSFAVRGEAVRIGDAPGHLPIGLMQDARVRRRVRAGEVVALDDVELPESLALRAWLETEAAVLSDAAARRPRAAAGG
jgi:predicted homoserine dehydrogenase-like protein